MARLIPNRLRPGDVLETDNHDEFLNTLVTGSANVGTNNLRNESVTADHLYIGAFTAYSGHTQKTTTSVYEHSGSSFTLVSDGVTPCSRTSMATTMSEGDALIVNASVETRHIISMSGDDDERRLRLYFKYDTGVGPTTVETFIPGSPIFTYSGRHIKTGSYDADDRIDYDKNVVSWVYIHTQAVDFVIQEVQLRAATIGSGDIIEFKHWNISAQIDKH